MKCRKVGKTDIEISEVSLGTWAVGEGYFGSIPEQDTIDAITESIERGITHIDTAELYGDGLSEELVGKAIRGKRDQVVLTSKVWTNHFRKADLIAACENSLQRLGTEYLDFYFLHYFVKDVPLEESLEAMMQLKEQGKIRAIGVSNFTVAQLIQANSLVPIDVHQPCYSLLWRYIEKDLVPYCLEHLIGIMAYSPLAQGLLTGKFQKDTQFDDGRSRAALFQSEYYGQCIDIADALQPFAEKYGKTPAQIAIQWVVASPGLTTAIVGAKNVKQAGENAAAGEFELEQEDYESISALSKDFCNSLPKFVNFFSSQIAEE